MARDFPGGSSFLTIADNLGITDVPMSVSGWMNLDTLIYSVLFWLGDQSVANHYIKFQYFGGTDAPVTFETRSGNPSNAIAETVNTLVSGWNHLYGETSAPTARRCVLNGDFANQGTNTTNRSFPTTNRTALGMARDSTPDGNVDGLLAEVGVWNVALTDAEVASLAAGVSPLRIRRANLVAYWPLQGNSVSGTFDASGNGFTLTETGTVDASAQHAPVMPPFAWDPIIVAVAAAAPAVDSALFASIAKRRAHLTRVRM